MISIFTSIIILSLVFYLVLRSKQIEGWFVPYIAHQIKGRPRTAGTVHIIFCFADHFEPRWSKPGAITELERVMRWTREYPALAARHRDSSGNHPKHTFFYPAEEYDPVQAGLLKDLCRQEFGEVEIHLHHDNDTPVNFYRTLSEFKRILHDRHGLLSLSGGEIRYGFIHGNWALNNSRKDGRWCGINNELEILEQTGCYADFTLPSAIGSTQTRKINSIYYASNIPGKRKSHDTGTDMTKGGAASGNLLIIQGPLCFNWKERKWGILPKIESGDISHDTLPSPARTDLWIKQHIHVRGQPDWVFVKVHTHGAPERNADVILGKPVDDMFSYLEQKYNDGKRYRLHYTSAREMYNICKAAEAGMTGNPADYRNFLIN